MKKKLKSVRKKAMGLIQSEAVVAGIIQFDHYGHSAHHAAAKVGWDDDVRFHRKIHEFPKPSFIQSHQHARMLGYFAYPVDSSNPLGPCKPSH